MKTIQFDGQLIRYSVLDECDDAEHDIEFIEKTEWVVEHKFQYCDFIFKYQDKFYSIPINRQGDHWKGYEWYDENMEDINDVSQFDCYEVKKVPVTKYEWRTVK